MKKFIYFILLLLPMLLQGMEHPHNDSIQTSNQREALLKSLLDFKILPENLDIQDDLSQLTLVWQDNHEQIPVKIKADISPNLTIELSKKSVEKILKDRPEFDTHTLLEPSYKPYINSINQKINQFTAQENDIIFNLEFKIFSDESKLKYNSTTKELKLLLDLYRYNSRMHREINFDELNKTILQRNG